MKKTNTFLLLYILAFSIIITILLKELYGNRLFSFFSFFKNTIALALLYIGYKKDKRIILLIPILYILLFFIYPVYSGQDLFLLPFTLIGDIMNNIQKIQNENLQQLAINDARIDITDRNWNFWYENINMKHKDRIYFFWMCKPGKYDDFFNIKLYSIKNQENNSNTKYHIEKVLPIESYKQFNKGNNNIVTVSFEDFYYYSSINYINKSSHIIIKNNNINIESKGKITVPDNFCSAAILNNVIPFNYILNYGPKFAGISDIYPRELVNDTMQISNSEITVNKIKDVNYQFQDIYVGSGHYFMTPYIWILNYTENFNILTIFFSDYPYGDFYVGFIHDKKNKKNIETGNVYLDSNFNKMFTGVSASIDTFGTKLCDKNIKYNIDYESPKVKLNIKSLWNNKCLDQFPLYKRINQDKNYNEAEELQKVMEQTTYNVLSGKSEITLEYNNKIYKEIGTTVIDSINWKDCKTGPDGYARKNEPFFKNPFYVYHPDRDKLNGKL